MLPEVWHFMVSAPACMANPRIHMEITKIPQRTHTDFFGVMVVFPFLVLKILLIFIKKHCSKKAEKKGPNGTLKSPGAYGMGILWYLLLITSSRRLEVML
jgi:hypothetical protein